MKKSLLSQNQLWSNSLLENDHANFDGCESMNINSCKKTTTYKCFRRWDELICHVQREDVPGETQIDLLIVRV